MALKKLCNHAGCKELIPYGIKFCDKHINIGNIDRKRQHKHYDEHRKDTKEWNFYKSKEWVQMREYILRKYKYIDLYAYYKENRIVIANTIHHIVEVKDDWSRRLDVDNLFVCSKETHNTIHELYKKDKIGTQKILKNFKKEYDKIF